MIDNDQELELIREQLDRAERALQAIRDEVRPVSEERFLLMAESYVDMICELRAQLDAYLGLDAVVAYRERNRGVVTPSDHYASTPGVS